MKDIYCKNCKFWVEEESYRKADDLRKQSQCHRYPPVIEYIEGVGFSTCQPWVYDTDWCGEWEESEVEDAA